ncbi:MAG: hypothetical protein HOO96_07070, partial [Polyangiaceae bacterium]|nr:hypothetical protein [Polyangiaceae bacterium]
MRYASGVVRCWGANGRGQVAAPASAAPLTVPVVWPTAGAILLGAGGDRTCVAVDGASRLVRCSGTSPGGDVGPGATVLETPALSNAASLSVSAAVVCLHQTHEYDGSRLQCDAPHAAIARFALPHPCAPRSLCQKRYGYQVALRGSDACLLEQNGPASKLQCSRGAAWSY